MDQNDVEPLFPQKSYAATVMENIPINSFIIKAEVCTLKSSEFLLSLREFVTMQKF